MPFVRHSRDRRGYEHLYLVHTTPARKGRPARSRVLYWYRTPPGVKVGREPFDLDTRRALEAQYPDLEFDWEKLAAPPPPPPPEEPWRERRRLQKARKARAALLEAEEAESEAADPAGEEAGGDETSGEVLDDGSMEETTVLAGHDERPTGEERVDVPVDEAPQARGGRDGDGDDVTDSAEPA